MFRRYNWLSLTLYRAQVKNISQLEHARHRSLTGFMLNRVASLIAYSYQTKKLALNLNSKALVVVDSDNCFHSFEQTV